MPSPSAQPVNRSDGLAAVLDALPIGLYVVDRDLRVVVWNRLRESGPIGRPRGKAVGRTLRSLLGPAGFRATEPVVRRVLATGEATEETVEARGRLFHVRRLPVRRGREVTHVVSWSEDVTARHELELRAIASDRLAFLGQLVSGVAHEIANPLAGIAGCAEALASLAAKAGPEPSREARQFRDLIRLELTRCERIVRFLLDSSRATAEERADVAATVGLALRLLERHPALARLRVRAQLARDLPPARIDADSLKQVVMALAMNAARAMPNGGTLSVRTSRDGRTLRIDVADTGPAVPSAARARLFTPYAVQEAQREGGLGLAIARSLLRSRGGDLSYRPRQGSNAFRVVLKAVPGTP